MGLIVGKFVGWLVLGELVVGEFVGFRLGELIVGGFDCFSVGKLVVGGFVVGLLLHLNECSFKST